MKRIAVVGCGAVFRELHASALRKLSQRRVVEVAALVDTGKDSLKRCARLFPSAHTFLDLEQALASQKPDVVLIATPPDAHHKQVEIALKNGCHVLCEKPFVTTAEAATLLADSSTRANRVLAVGQTRRFFPSLATAAAMVSSGRLGDGVRFIYREGEPCNWPLTSDALLRRSTSGGGVLADRGVHVLDSLRWILGDLRVTAAADDAEDEGVETNIEVGISAALGEGTVRLSSDQTLHNGFWLRGSDAELFIRPECFGYVLHKKRGGDWVRLPCETSWPDEMAEARPHRMRPRTYDDCILLQWVALLRSIDYGESTPVSALDAASVIGQIERGYRMTGPLAQQWRGEESEAATRERHWKRQIVRRGPAKPLKLAVLGAGGFVGARFFEIARADPRFEMLAIVRSYRGAARLARYGPVWRHVATTDPERLVPIIKGCDAVVNLTVGEPDRMSSTAESIWQACVDAGVERLIHMSSAEVFGRVESPQINDDSKPLRHHWMPYARAKIATEQCLQGRFSDRRVATTILRPGLVWGPRSPWVGGPAADIAAGRAFLVGGGEGVCNLIYVDNLVEQVLAVVRHPSGQSACYNISDDDPITWRAYYAAIAREIGCPFEMIHQLPGGKYSPTLATRIADLKRTAVAEWLKLRLSRPAKLRIKALIDGVVPGERCSGLYARPEPRLTRDGWHQQSVVCRLSNSKFRERFGRGDEVPFSEAMTRTGMWLRSAGYTGPTVSEPR